MQRNNKHETKRNESNEHKRMEAVIQVSAPTRISNMGSLSLSLSETNTRAHRSSSSNANRFSVYVRAAAVNE